MTFREELIESIKGKPGSLTSQAFNTGEICERERIIRILNNELSGDLLDNIVWLINDRNIL